MNALIRTLKWPFGFWKYPVAQVVVLWYMADLFLENLKDNGFPSRTGYRLHNFDWQLFDFDLEEYQLLIRILAIIGPPAWVWRVQTKKIISFLNNAAKNTPNK